MTLILPKRASVVPCNRIVSDGTLDVSPSPADARHPVLFACLLKPRSNVILFFSMPAAAARLDSSAPFQSLQQVRLTSKSGDLKQTTTREPEYGNLLLYAASSKSWKNPFTSSLFTMN
jgi:hypothetical protein